MTETIKQAVGTDAIPQQRHAVHDHLVADAGRGDVSRHRTADHRQAVWAVVSAVLLTVATVVVTLVATRGPSTARPQPTPPATSWTHLLTDPLSSSSPAPAAPAGRDWLGRFITGDVH